MHYKSYETEDQSKQNIRVICTTYSVLCTPPTHIIQLESNRTLESAVLSMDFAIFGNQNNFC